MLPFGKGKGCIAKDPDNIILVFPNQHKWVIQKADLLCCEGCQVDDDCKWNNEKCDQEDHICRPRCTENEDCNSIPCNTEKGVCDPSKILFNCKDSIKQILKII